MNLSSILTYKIVSFEILPCFKSFSGSPLPTKKGPNISAFQTRALMIWLLLASAFSTLIHQRVSNLSLNSVSWVSGSVGCPTHDFGLILILGLWVQAPSWAPPLGLEPALKKKTERGREKRNSSSSGSHLWPTQVKLATPSLVLLSLQYYTIKACLRLLICLYVFFFSHRLLALWGQWSMPFGFVYQAPADHSVNDPSCRATLFAIC